MPADLIVVRIKSSLYLLSQINSHQQGQNPPVLSKDVTMKQVLLLRETDGSQCQYMYTCTLLYSQISINKNY